MTLNIVCKKTRTKQAYKKPSSYFLFISERGIKEASLGKKWSNMTDNTWLHEYLSKLYCMHYYSKHFQSLSSVFRLALCALAVKSQLNPPVTVQQNLAINQHKQYSLPYKTSKSFTLLKFSGHTNIFGAVSSFPSRHTCMLFAGTQPRAHTALQHTVKLIVDLGM